MRRILFYLIALKFLVGCGEDSSKEETTPTQSTALQPYSDADLEKWRKLCIDDNIPLIEIGYQNCLLAPGIYGVEGCENAKAENTYRLNAVWPWIKAEAAIALSQCNADPRTGVAGADYCRSEYEYTLGFYVSLKCQEQATWH